MDRAELIAQAKAKHEENVSRAQARWADENPTAENRQPWVKPEPGLEQTWAVKPQMGAHKLNQPITAEEGEKIGASTLASEVALPALLPIGAAVVKTVGGAMGKVGNAPAMAVKWGLNRMVPGSGTALEVMARRLGQAAPGAKAVAPEVAETVAKTAPKSIPGLGYFPAGEQTAQAIPKKAIPGLGYFGKR